MFVIAVIVLTEFGYMNVDILLLNNDHVDILSWGKTEFFFHVTLDISNVISG